MVLVTLDEGYMLKNLVETVVHLVRYATFEFRPEGMFLIAFNDAQSLLVKLCLNREVFQLYQLQQNFLMRIDLFSMSDMLKFVEEDVNITINAAPGVEHITFELRSLHRTSVYNLTQLVVNHGDILPDVVDDITMVEMPSSNFEKICKSLLLFDEKVRISINRERISFHAPGLRGDVRTVVHKNSSMFKPEEEVSIQMGQINQQGQLVKQEGVILPAERVFSLPNLNKVVKATPLSPRVTVGLKEEFALVVEYNIGTAGYIRYYLGSLISDKDGSQVVGVGSRLV